MTATGKRMDIMAAADTGLPFRLPPRPAVRRIRSPRVTPATRVQPMRGFDATYTDIVDYIVRITDEIWADRAVGRIYETYAAACHIYSSYGVVRTVEEVVASTIASLTAFPDGVTEHVNVAWSGDEDDFYTSHLGIGRSTNLGASSLGPATGRRAVQRFVADCISRDNRIHTEWLVRDAGAQVRALGFDPDAVARQIAATRPAELPVFAPPAPPPLGPLGGPRDTLDGWVRDMFHELWNRKRLDRLGDYYATDIVAWSGGGRTVTGLRALGDLLAAILTAVAGASMTVENVCHSDEGDGVIVAVRWLLQGATRPGGVLGDVSPDLPVNMMGMSHLRFAGPRIVEEWTVFDEVGVLVGAYRA